MGDAAPPRMPPLEVVSQVVAALRAHGAEAAVGGSGLLAGRAASVAGGTARARFIVAAADHEVDVIVGFALEHGDRIVHFPTRVTRTWRGLPIADPLVWLDTYRLLGRTDRADLLQIWVDQHGHATSLADPPADL